MLYCIVEAIPDDIVGFHVENVSVNEMQRGFILSGIDNDPAKETASFLAQV